MNAYISKTMKAEAKKFCGSTHKYCSDETVDLEFSHAHPWPCKYRKSALQEYFSPYLTLIHLFIVFHVHICMPISFLLCN